MKNEIKTRSRFERLLQAWRNADAKAKDYASLLHKDYGNERHAPTGKAKRLEGLYQEEQKRSEAFFVLLNTISPRNWMEVVPYVWIRAYITWDMAITREKLPMIPPASWGHTEFDARRFASEVRTS